MEVNTSFLSGSKKFSYQQQQQEEDRSKNFVAALTMRTPMKKKKIVLWSIVFWCFGKLKIIQSVRCSLSAGVADDLCKEDFWITGATQERKSSNFLMFILKFLKKYSLSNNCRSLTKIFDKCRKQTFSLPLLRDFPHPVPLLTFVFDWILPPFN